MGAIKLSVLFPETRDVGRAVELAEQSESAGFHGMWLGAAFGFDPIMALALAGARTSRLVLGTSVVPTWPRHPVVMAQQAATAAAATGGRFRLGVGPSHVPVMEHMYGIPFERPVGHVREYLGVVHALLEGKPVAAAGERYKVNAFLDVAMPGPPPVLLSALGEQLCGVAGELADGVLPWLAPPDHLAGAIVPWVRAGAEKAGREPPPIVALAPCVLTSDFDTVREVANGALAIYPRMPFYAAMLERAGVPDAAAGPKRGWTDAMIEAAIPWGDEDALAARAQAYLDAGADEVAFSPVVGDDKTLEVLGDIARG